MKYTQAIVVDEKKFEKWLKDMGVKFTKTKDHYKLEKPVELSKAIGHGVQTANIGNKELDANNLVDLKTKLGALPYFMIHVKQVPGTALCKHYSTFCMELQKRLTFGSLKYGPSWKEVNLLKELEQELLDLAGYAFLEWLKRGRKISPIAERKLCAIASAAVVLWEFVKEMEKNGKK